MKTEIEKITEKQIKLIEKFSKITNKPTKNISDVIKTATKIALLAIEITELERQKRKPKYTNYPKGAIMFKSETGEELIKRFENIESKEDYMKRIDEVIKNLKIKFPTRDQIKNVK